jgi:hypothetical protein
MGGILGGGAGAAGRSHRGDEGQVQIETELRRAADVPARGDTEPAAFSVELPAPNFHVLLIRHGKYGFCNTPNNVSEVKRAAGNDVKLVIPQGHNVAVDVCMSLMEMGRCLSRFSRAHSGSP